MGKKIVTNMACIRVPFMTEDELEQKQELSVLHK